MLYPRAFAVAERAWSPADVRDPLDFRKRAEKVLGVLKTRGYNSFDMDSESELARSGFRTFDAFEKAKLQSIN